MPVRPVWSVFVCARRAAHVTPRSLKFRRHPSGKLILSAGY